MADVRPEFQALDRDELLALCEELASRTFMPNDVLAALILRARWEVAVERARKAADVYSDAFDATMDLKKRRGKLTSARLAEEEKADRRLRMLSRAEAKARNYERGLWEQIYAEWDQGGEAA